MYKRRYFLDVRSVAPTPGCLPEPSDGAVAIHVETTAARKIKSVKSIELQLMRSEDGVLSLVTSDGLEMLPGFSPGIELNEGDIVELRVSPGSKRGFGQESGQVEGEQFGCRISYP